VDAPLDRRKQTKLKCLHDPSQINGGNVKYEGSRQIRNKKREYLKDRRIDDLAMNNKNIKAYRDMDLSGVTNLKPVCCRI
jgi:hypothetical protein